jgi:hypothetical protein
MRAHIDEYRALVGNQRIITALTPHANHGVLLTPEGPMPWSADAVIKATVPGAQIGDALVASATVLFCSVQCARSTYPLWRLDKELVTALLDTDPAPWEMPPGLPYPGLYGEIPEGTFAVENRETGLHWATGFYLVETPYQDRPTGEWKRGLLLVGTGTIRSVSEFGLDDALIFMLVGPDGPTGLSAAHVWPKGGAELWRLVANFLYALRTRNIEPRAHVPSVPKSPKKQKRALRRDADAFRPFATLHLSEQPGPPKARGSRTSSKVRSHIRRGHFHHYWVLEARAGHVAVLEREGKPPLYRVARWIRMTRVGSGEAVRPQVHVR